MSDARQIFTLKQVAASIRKTIEERYQKLYWVKAEMHKVNRYPSGHAFPELVQKEGDKIVAQMTGTIWSQHFERINKQFIQVVKQPLKEGTNLLMQVKITYSEIFGLSLQIVDIDPSYSLGELQREREETLKKLQKEGLLNANQQLDFPVLPQRIALISADTSKGYSDFMKVIEQNPWGYKFFTMLFPAYLQGDVAVASILEQLGRIRKVLLHFDIVVIVRGGGGEVGMTCYNNFELCKEIATFPIPVLTGIGHSTNLTVAEMISFRNAITPTELGEFLIQAFHEFSVPVQDARKLLRDHARRLMEYSRNEFNNETKHFRNAAQLYLNRSGQELHNASRTIQGQAKTLLGRQREALKSKENDLKMKGIRSLKEEGLELVEYVEKVRSLSLRSIEIKSKELASQIAMVRILDPLNILKRGFSITTYKGRTISKEMEIEPGSKLNIITHQYAIVANVDSISSIEGNASPIGNEEGNS
jgi:exodeoxyribonuclease VII large subunit